MSEAEKADVDQELVEEGTSALAHSPTYQYSRGELLRISKTAAAQRRPLVLESAFDSEDGIWDPENWVRATFGFQESSPHTVAEGKDRRCVELDRDIKRRPSLNDPLERLKENERDGIVLSPQRRSFGTGCHVQQSSVFFSRQISIEKERDRDEPRVERERDRERERPVRKIGSGRIQIDRENSRDFSGLRDRYDERDRDYAWNQRDRPVDRERDRDYRDGDRDRDRRYDRSDRVRRTGDRDFPERDRRDYRDRGYDRSSRRRNYRDEEKEPEWFTGGPTSQNDTIELRGFVKEGEEDNEDTDNSGLSEKPGSGKKKSTLTQVNAIKESAGEDVPEADGVQSQCSSPEEDQLHPGEDSHTDLEASSGGSKHRSVPSQHSQLITPIGSTPFDFDQILKASLPLDEETTHQGISRFSQFFAGHTGGKHGSEMSSLDNLLMPHDLLESRSSPGVPSPTTIGPMGAMQHQQYTHYLQHFDQQQVQARRNQEHVMMAHHGGVNHMAMPNSAGDNNGGAGSAGGGSMAAPPSLPPMVTALFNSAAVGGSNASISSNNSFSAQDAEAQLKAMLFGGPKDSASSSGTASPSLLPASVQKVVKTVAELEADMHQNSPKKMDSPVPHSSSDHGSAGDLTAFNKLLIMLNAGSEASHNVVTPEVALVGHVPHGMMPGHSEFNHALMRNKEQQLQLFHQSLQNPQQRGTPILKQQQQPHTHLSAAMHQHHRQMSMHQQQHLQQQQFQHHMSQQPPPPISCSQGQSSGMQGLNIKPGLSSHSMTPQAMSTPQLNHMSKLSSGRAQSSGIPGSCGPTSDPIFNLIQQHPTIVMNPASPAPLPMVGSQQPAGPNTGRISSPLMFSQQPPLHLSAPSPIHPGQLSPHSLTVGANLAANTMQTASGMGSPVLRRIPSPQELSAHAQAVMINALIKKQLHDQSERYLKKQQERAKSPNQQHITVVKPQPEAQLVIPPTPQPKGATLNSFTPTSVLRKMHSDKAIEKEKQSHEGKGEQETEFMPSMLELSGGMHPEERLGKPKAADMEDISFLDPVNPNLVALGNSLDSNLRLGQANLLPGGLTHPMSVEEKVERARSGMKLSILAENPGYLSQMLDKSKAAAAEVARTGHGRPIVKVPVPCEQLSVSNNCESPPCNLPLNFQQLMGPPPPMAPGSRPVTGTAVATLPQGDCMAVAPPLSFSTAAATGQAGIMTNNKCSTGGRAIIGGNSMHQQHSQMSPSGSVVTEAEFMRMMESQQRLQQPHSQGGMVLPPPPLATTPIHCLGPPPPVGARIPVGAPVHSAALMQQHQIARGQQFPFVSANAMNVHNQQMSQLIALQQQQRGLALLPPLHTVNPHGLPGSAPSLSPQTHAGALSPAALSATLQRVASPHSAAIKMNGPPPHSSGMTGVGHKPDIGGGIQRWFSPDILRTQFSSMPPLPTQVMTVDELERN